MNKPSVTIDTPRGGYTAVFNTEEQAAQFAQIVYSSPIPASYDEFDRMLDRMPVITGKRVA